MDNERLNILRLLIESQEKAFSIRQIGIQRKINYKTAYTSLKALAEEGIVTQKKHGNTTICSFSHKFNHSVFHVEYARLNDLLKNKDLLVLYSRLSKVNGQFILLLFGSYAKGQPKKGSDIDLLLISDSPKPIEEQISLLPLNIHLTHISYDNFRSMLNSKEFSVVSEAVKHNILLFGIEDYYRMINNAR
ncbi:MAG: nucleotidyltransferase domain-containing protein [Candidatus Woesearchaeota archaeon]